MARMHLGAAELQLMLAASAAAFLERIGEQPAQTLTAAIDKAIGTARTAAKDGAEAKTETANAWRNWIGVGNMLASTGASEADAKLVILARMAGQSELAQKSAEVYVSRVVSLVPILKLPDTEYKALWEKAGLDVEDKDGKVLLTRDVKQTQGVRLINAARNRKMKQSDVLREYINAITKELKTRGKPTEQELETAKDEAEKTRLKNEAIAHAQDLCQTIAELIGMDLPAFKPEDMADAEPDADDTEADAMPERPEAARAAGE